MTEEHIRRAKITCESLLEFIIKSSRRLIVNRDNVGLMLTATEVGSLHVTYFDLSFPKGKRWRGTLLLEPQDSVVKIVMWAEITSIDIDDDGEAREYPSSLFVDMINEIYRNNGIAIDSDHLDKCLTHVHKTVQ